MCLGSEALLLCFFPGADKRLRVGSNEILSRSEGQDTVVIDLLSKGSDSDSKILGKTTGRMWNYFLSTVASNTCFSLANKKIPCCDRRIFIRSLEAKILTMKTNMCLLFFRPQKGLGTSLD